MIVATVVLFGVLALIGGCHAGEWFPPQDGGVVDLVAYLNVVSGAGMATFVIWIGKWAEDE